MMHLFLLLTQLVWATPQAALYERPCYVDEGDALTTHLQVSENQWILTHLAYEEDACKQAYLAFEIQYTTATAGTEVDLTVSESSYTPLTEEVAEALNMVKYCDYTDWKRGEKKVVSGYLCDEYKAPNVGDKTYSIFKTEQKDGAELLYIGAASAQGSGKSPSQRHKKYEPLPFFKQ
ncbi:hypothetical protein ACNH6C_09350 [Bdellovibrio bacteriovorus]|uniref:hypothetical protein n=1 Tax=Bdellovibrio bacteriovorus TaxID=959 RepID=UPI003A808373